MLPRNAYANSPHGSATWAQSPRELAPLLRSGWPHLGYFHGHALSYLGDGPILTTGGAGSAKTASVVIPTLINLRASGTTPVFFTDPGGQAAKVAGATFCFNPSGLHPGLARDRCNPLSFLKPDSPTLYEDCAAIGEAVVERSGSGEAKFWDEYSADMARFAANADALINGCTSLPAMWTLMRRLSTNDTTSDDFFREVITRLVNSRYDTTHVLQDAIELFDLKKNNERVWTGMMATLKNAIGATAAQSLGHALTGNDFNLEVLVNRKLWTKGKAPSVSYCIPGEQKHTWRAITRVFLVAIALLARRRADMSVRPYLLIDEAGALGNSPFVTTAVSEDRKVYQSHFVFQAVGQLEKNFGEAGAREILASASVRQFLGANDPQTAGMISEMLGTMTLQRQNPIRRSDRQHLAQRTLRSLFTEDVPLVENWINAGHETRQSAQLDQAPRSLLTPAEILTMPSNRQVVFVSGFNPILAERRPYFTDPRFKGRYAADPFHPSRKPGLLAMIRGALT